MWNTIVKHLYCKVQRSLINKLFFRNKFISKKIRLKISSFFRFISFNFWRTVIWCILMICVGYLIYSFIHIKDAIPFATAVFTSAIAIVLAIVPKRQRIQGLVVRHQDTEGVNIYGNTIYYQYYALTITNPNDIAVVVDKLFLTNGDLEKGYDVVYLNSREDIPTKVDDRHGYITGKPADIAVIPAKSSLTAKFATVNNFQFSYIQTRDKKLIKIEVESFQYRSEYDYKHRAIFTTSNSSSNIDQVMKKKWMNDTTIT